ncbi:phosphoribosylaminoimidazole carboxylase [Fomitiporia mediterranea MF3/22]|uniref:phosphoribosylaminoimidazole carboxylase n=1 Tax=Fomitiporia mediterranea (strain MF3/22) TaxID=694068 RepID=UPI000440944E|nr:phosphoribosylaminoimidazole carboxylase [Fomitiporia mediterranea MF3/22]EJD00766.1 phosphoribosylaminoimidazole carboxylase [Fomitiporia mediterranea MF3/22]
MESRKVGILGESGGQLGRMLAASASLFNIDVAILDVGDHAPAKQIVSSPPHLGHVDGSFSDPEKIKQLAAKVDVLTVEIEHVDVTVLEEITQSSRIIEIHPSPATIRIIQDKLQQKQHLSDHGLSVADYMRVESTAESIESAAAHLGLPLMLKSRTLAYDGRGNYVLQDLTKTNEAVAALGGRPLYAERLVSLAKELAVMVVRTTSGDIRSYPVVETVHKDNICHIVYAPFRHSNPDVAIKARALAEETVRTFTGAGVFGVEMFLLDDGAYGVFTVASLFNHTGIDTILVNEIAPRPHNSGHYTIEACYTSQYENHLRAILSLPLGSTELKVQSAIMLNLLGYSNSMSEITRVAHAALTIPGASVHLYGKRECRKGRKMGHITLVGDSDAAVRENLRPLLQALPDATPESVEMYAPLLPEPNSGKSASQPLVGIIMGSDSDLPVMIAAARVLDSFRVPYELTIVSAHRTPKRMTQYAGSAAGRGLRVIIAGAGGAAHLPGMVAAMTPLPVIGVPVKGSTLDGVDSLHSIVQMPRGIPVATVAINNSTNAALLAVRIISASVPSLLEAMNSFIKKQEEEVYTKVTKIEEVGWEKYGKS